MMLYNLRDKGILIQPSRGFFLLSAYPPLENQNLIQIALSIPQRIICLISALAFHNLTTQIPHRIWITLPRGIKRPIINYPPLEFVWRAPKPYQAGIQEHTLVGVTVRIYSSEKTIADCLRFENRVGRDVVLEALKEYRRQNQVHTDDLMYFSQVNKVQERMQRYLEILL